MNRQFIGKKQGKLMHVPVEKLRSFMIEATIALPLDRVSAETMVDNLITANLWGINSHGISRYPVYMKRLKKNLVNRTPDIKITKTLPAMISVDGDNGLGSVVTLKALNEALTLADAYGIAGAGIRSSNHMGALGYYADIAAKKGYITIICTVGPANMPPFGGMEPYFSTNPLAIGIPVPDGQPVIIDMATSMAAKGKIREAVRKGEKIPEGWAIDKDGNPTTNAQAAVDGLVLPMSGHKGSALALMIECFAGVLTGSTFGTEVVMQYGDDPRPANVGHWLIVFKPEGFLSTSVFKSRMKRFCSELRAIKPAKGFEKVLLPGDKERITTKKINEQGIEIDDALLEQLKEIANESGVAFPV
jgi:LDH2 family malate/lactate/ureidoglycolate dehydrogenase